MLVCGVYIMWKEQFTIWKVITVVGSIVLTGALTCCVLPYSIYVGFESWTDEYAV